MSRPYGSSNAGRGERPISALVRLIVFLKRAGHPRLFHADSGKLNTPREFTEDGAAILWEGAPIARLVGNLVITELRCTGEFKFKPTGGLVLTELHGQGMLQAELRTGPLRVPLRTRLRLEGRGPALSLRPLEGAGLLWVLGPFLRRLCTGEAAWRLYGSEIQVDLGRATDGRVRLAGGGNPSMARPEGIKWR
ncbi:MAG: hypothetical protein ACM3ZC_12920 [Bacteroidota bacterium]